MGIALVITTWASYVLSFIAIGLPLALLATRGRLTSAAIRSAAWFGLVIFVLLAMTMNFLVALRSGLVAVSWIAAVGLGLLLSLIMRQRSAEPWRVSWTRSRRGERWASIAVLSALTLVVVVLAILALGPATSFDTGLYHLGAIFYAAEYPTIPGLANLYFPFGYSNSFFSLTAALTNGPFGLDAWRLSNGLLVAMLIGDLALRIGERRRGPSLYASALATFVATALTMPQGDGWIASPTPDTATLVATFVAIVYSIDALSSSRINRPAIAVALAGATWTATMRPTMIAFSAMIAGSLLVREWPRRRTRTLPPGMLWPAVTALVGATALVVLARDAVLSGWLLYPASLMRLPFDWTTADPTPARLVTVGYARVGPGSAAVDGAPGFAWLGPWLTDYLPQNRGTLALLAVIAALGVAAGLVRLRRPLRSISAALGPMLLAWLPSFVAVVAWLLLAPPSLRFIWGPLFGLVIVPTAWLLDAARDTGHPRMDTALWSVGSLAFVLVGIAASLLRPAELAYGWQRIDIGPVEVAVAALPDVPTHTVRLASELEIIVPEADGARCWDVFPMCSPVALPGLGFRGSELADGFRVR